MYVLLRNLSIICCLFIFEGCAISVGTTTLSEELNFSVTVINEGSYKIEVLPFKLNKLEKMSVDVGYVMPGGKASIGNFFYRPERNHTIQWKLVETGKVFNAKVVLDLPKEFNKQNGSTIRFFINPNGPSIKVMYKIFDRSTDSYFEVSG